MTALRPCWLFLLLLVAPFGLTGQELPEVPEFSTVRIRSAPYTGEATLLRLAPDTLDLGVEGLSQPVLVPIETITRLEYRRSATRRERATRGALWGGGIFGVMGFAITDRAEDQSGFEVGLAHAIPGALIGACIGLLIPRSRWERVSLGGR